MNLATIIQLTGPVLPFFYGIFGIKKYNAGFYSYNIKKTVS